MRINQTGALFLADFQRAKPFQTIVQTVTITKAQTGNPIKDDNSANDMILREPSSLKTLRKKTLLPKK